MSEDIKRVADELGRAFEDFKEKHERELAEVKAGLNAAPADLAKVEQALDELQAAKDALEAKAAAERKRLDDLEKRFSRPAATSSAGDAGDRELKAFNALTKSFAGAMNRPHPAEVGVDEYAAYKAGFAAYLRKGKEDLDFAERKAMSVGQDAEGGYLVHADMTGRIASKVFELSPIRQIAGVQAISTDALEGITDTDDLGDAVWVNDTTAPADTDSPQVGKWRIPAEEAYLQPKATQRLLEDAAVDVEAWLVAKLANKIARTEGAAFVAGTGVGKPRGFTAYTTAATDDGSRAWGTLEHVLSGANGDFASSSPADKLFDLVGALKDVYLANARFVTRKAVITKVRKFKEATTNGYIWQPGLQQGMPAQLLGYPVTMAEDMPALATNSLSLAFGDFATGYQIVDRLGMVIVRDALTDKPYVKFYTRFRVGGAVTNFEAIKLLKFAS